MIRKVLTRRRFTKGLAAAALLAPLAACGRDQAVTNAEPSPFEPESTQRTADFVKLEDSFGAVLGLYALDTGTGRELSHHPDERFGYASTFKALLAGAILREYTLEQMDEIVEYSHADLVAHSPIAEQHVDTGMSMYDLCEATVRYSDNAAANLLLAKLDGPAGLNAVLKELGDDVTRMERYEPGMSDIVEGDTRDTTTPRAFADNLRAFVLGDVLEDTERETLTQWLRTNVTGGELIAAGVPEDWVVGSKTGMGATYGIRNNIGVAWPPSSEPIVMAIMSKYPDQDAEHDNALIARAAAIVADEFG
ncbi:class A beta-lactamase [Natronoglycomyces albus]|uniref:Beta-lactamase n=1 Tax=Natronoglycomyces albus TaxID=2811108 RepID=A0A895XS03_9ACTN|nr:class A beta-lactamase [Natronoglycomyces albus]QSB06472.1 class A beta-lactamase [Natronoglycomyces albus]